MNLKAIYYNNLIDHINDNKIPILRFILYILIASVFYKFMQIYSPLGIKWTSYHNERTINAIQNIFENFKLTLIGYTSFEDPVNVRENLQNNVGTIYIQKITTYIFPAFFYKLFGEDKFLHFGKFIDYSFISLTGLLVAEIGLRCINIKKNFESIFYGITIFSLFLASPWTYRMMLAPWFEVGFLGFYLLSIFLFIKKKVIGGLFFQSLSFLIHWLWGFLIFFFIITLSFLNLKFKDNLKYQYLPKGLQTKQGFFLYLFSCITPFSIHFILTLLVRINGINTSNSSALYRVGIDSIDNIHHGGLIGAFQFLGGNRFSVCFNPDNLNQLNQLQKSISIFNCSLSITSLVFISLLSILGICLVINKNVHIKWILIPVSWSFLFFNFIFQQSFAVHLQGHSYIFSLLFSIGFTYLIKYSFEFLKLSNVVGKILMLPLIIGVTINLIRVSFLTGING